MKILDFHEKGVLPRLAKLMKHREAAVSKRYRVLAKQFIKKYGIDTDNYVFKKGRALEGFMPDWIGRFYAYYQWYYNISSFEVLKKVPLEFLKKAYFGLHDLELELAVIKVGDN